jgi:hypothetical protein
MVIGLVYAPHVLPPALAAWAVAAGAGLWLAISGIRPALKEGDDAASWAVSLAAIGGGGVALGLGWNLPGGAFWSLASEGLYVAAAAAGAANVSLSLAARGYEAGYIAGSLARIGRFGFAEMPGVDDTEWHRAQDTIATLTMERDRLADDLARVGPPARDLEEILRFPGVRKSVLKELHRDSHAGVSDREARALDERFKKANAVFERIAG